MSSDLLRRAVTITRRLSRHDERRAEMERERAEVFREAVDSGAVTIAELVKQTGMSRSQVERIVKQRPLTGRRPDHDGTPTPSNDGS